MKLPNGQFTRRVGLLVELVCMLGLLSASRGKVDFWARQGLDPTIVLGTGMAIGFALWLFGTVTILRGRKRPEREI